MEHELSREDYAEASEATLAGIEQGVTNAEQQWRNDVKWIVFNIAKRSETFTVNDIREQVARLPVKTHDGRALGGILKQAEKAGIIERTGKKVPSVKGHFVPVEVWRSKIYKV